MKIKVLFFIFSVALLGCKKRDTATYPLPDYTAEVEAEFPYKDIKKPIVFMNEDSSKTIVINIKSKTTYISKNGRHANVSNLYNPSLASIHVLADNFAYTVTSLGAKGFDHSFKLYNVSTSLENAYVGSNLSFYGYRTILFSDTVYYDVMEFYANDNYGSKSTPISRILMTRKMGIIGFYNTDEKDWFYLKQ